MLALLVALLCFLSIVDGAIPQMQMSLLGGQMLVGNSLVKAVLLVTVLLGYILRPEVALLDIPKFAWWACVAFLVVDAGFLAFSHDTSAIGVIQSYSSYYVLLLIGPALPAFRDAVSERAIIRCVIFFFLICAIIGVAQNLMSQPILYTESSDGAFKVYSWGFFGETRAFSLFTSPMSFGIFCALCGALGVALVRTLPVRGALLFTASALACYCTLTRLCYLVFVCACTCALVLTFGRKLTRCLWYPLVYFVFGIVVVATGLLSQASSDPSGLKDSSSLFERVFEWAYYSDMLARATTVNQLFGLGVVQNDNVLPTLQMAIDNSFLALALHIGIIGLLLFGVLITGMWLYLRSEAIATQQPFIIAAASLWATLPCAGIYNIVFSTYGAVFALVILCAKVNSGKNTIRDAEDGQQPATMNADTGPDLSPAAHNRLSSSSASRAHFSQLNLPA
jgi:hypothetical protein